MATVSRHALPGFSLSLGYSVCYLGLLVLVPLAASFLKAASLSLAATVLHVHPLGALVRVWLQAQAGDRSLNVELSPERCMDLDLKSGDRVYVAPRRPRMFVPDYSI